MKLLFKGNLETIKTKRSWIIAFKHFEQRKSFFDTSKPKRSQDNFFVIDYDETKSEKQIPEFNTLKIDLNRTFKKANTLRIKKEELPNPLFKKISGVNGKKVLEVEFYKVIIDRKNNIYLSSKSKVLKVSFNGQNPEKDTLLFLSYISFSKKEKYIPKSLNFSIEPILKKTESHLQKMFLSKEQLVRIISEKELSVYEELFFSESLSSSFESKESSGKFITLLIGENGKIFLESDSKKVEFSFSMVPSLVQSLI